MELLPGLVLVPVAVFERSTLCVCVVCVVFVVFGLHSVSVSESPEDLWSEGLTGCIPWNTWNSVWNIWNSERNLRSRPSCQDFSLIWTFFNL